jgi:hypothetical protein
VLEVPSAVDAAVCSVHLPLTDCTKHLLIGSSDHVASRFGRTFCARLQVLNRCDYTYVAK